MLDLIICGKVYKLTDSRNVRCQLVTQIDVGHREEIRDELVVERRYGHARSEEPHLRVELESASPSLTHN
jgi:hypothetical protein